ncbi:hypothetical protein GCM10010112_18810 [Actinoplanes lobatus]|uniref:Uncharacterized protein n=1 Tax=Actinoplanes lobatus TaxID=113568 RepID=A0ABQ4AK40_9ACTN|nr:hypothetical protein GCM10010112_18810 [Actinoplanes lobatus]GIE41368.1 hypothetical protein Alo02nite_42660 [Actinoplanes lobatus]
MGLAGGEVGYHAGGESALDKIESDSESSWAGDGETGFFEGLPSGGMLEGFTKFQMAAG